MIDIVPPGVIKVGHVSVFQGIYTEYPMITWPSVGRYNLCAMGSTFLDPSGHLPWLHPAKLFIGSGSDEIISTYMWLRDDAHRIIEIFESISRGVYVDSSGDLPSTWGGVACEPWKGDSDLNGIRIVNSVGGYVHMPRDVCAAVIPPLEVFGMTGIFPAEAAIKKSG